MDILEFFSRLNKQTTVLTPNRRLSATLHDEYDSYQVEKGLCIWEKIDILPIKSWFNRAWIESTSKIVGNHPLLLNAQQNKLIWENIILSSKIANDLLQLSPTTQQVKSAYQLIQEWEINLEKNEIFDNSEDFHAFKTWAISYRQQCQENHWIDETDIPSLIFNYPLKFPSCFYLYGFNEINPQLNRFFKRCETMGINTISINGMNKVQQMHRTSCIDSESEIIALARWAKNHSLKNSKAKIICVLPELNKIRDRVFQIFSEIFFNQSTYFKKTEDLPFNISAGKPLSQMPMIKMALKLIALNNSVIRNEEINLLLTSPFIGEAESERNERALLDIELKKYNLNRLYLDDILSHQLPINILEKCPYLFQRLDAFYHYKNTIKSAASLEEWFIYFHTLLEKIGWPGERSLNSEEYQVIDAWLNLFNYFKQLDIVSGSVTLTRAKDILYALCEEQLFQLQTPKSNIQILGLLEASGLRCDHLWLAGMDDLHFPSLPKPNPFLPKSLQREKNMPHSSAEREFIFCQNLFEQFKTDAKEIIYSYCEKKEEIELNPSPFILSIPYISLKSIDSVPFTSLVETIYRSRQLEKITDHYGPEIKTNIYGGVNVIKYQALCPFKSFSEWRLNSKNIEKTSLGLKNKDRGTIIHHVLAIIWETLKDQKTLLEISATELTELIDHSIESAFLKYELVKKRQPIYFALEKKRIHHLLNEWLTFEKKREPFRVMNQEKEATIQLKAFTIKIKLDRLDELMDGSRLVIDYKTSNYNNIQAFLSERPEEPQLPLYALLDSANILGITYAEIYPGQLGFKGVSQHDIGLKGIRPINEIKQLNQISWTEQLKRWKNNFDELSLSFSKGEAIINPKEQEKTCSFCHLSSLCRIREEIHDA